MKGICFGWGTLFWDDVPVAIGGNQKEQELGTPPSHRCSASMLEAPGQILGVQQVDHQPTCDREGEASYISYTCFDLFLKVTPNTTKYWVNSFF